jgi:hypothetical protein
MPREFPVIPLIEQGGRVGIAQLNRLVPRYNITAEEADETTYLSYLGTPVYSPLEFMKVAGTSLDNSLDVAGQRNGNSEVLLKIDTVLITVEQSKTIIKTPIQGRNGTVKEYISDGDFMINMRGVIISPYLEVFPADEVKLFIELMAINGQIPVASDFLARFSIYNIVIERYSIAQKLGSRNEVPFEITALSDIPLEFELQLDAQA